MNRRDMLRLLLGSAAAAVVDFEKLLWVPKPIVVVPAMPLSLTPAQSQRLLKEWIRRMDPAGNGAALIAMLNQSNEILDDMTWVPDWRRA